MHRSLSDLAAVFSPPTIVLTQSWSISAKSMPWVGQRRNIREILRCGFGSDAKPQSNYILAPEEPNVYRLRSQPLLRALAERNVLVDE